MLLGMHTKGIRSTANDDTPSLKRKRGGRTQPIRTIFIDITTVKDSETYRLLEICFKDDLFDELEVLSVCEYR